MFEIMPILDSTKNTPLYLQLYEYIKNQIQNGVIKPETKLPPKRKLSEYLGISQNTIQTAYDQLRAEGYLESRPRKGIYAKLSEDDLFHYAANTAKFENQKYVTEKNELASLINFSSGNIDLDSFPYTVWRKLTVQSLFPEYNGIFSLGDAQGEQYLREEISKYLFQSRGVKCLPEQIVIGAGTQFLLLLLCMLIGKDYTYAIENPGFHRARYVFSDQNIDIQPISVDKEGISIEELKKSSAKAVYVTPSHQFPYGMVMPISRRIELLKWSVETGAYIIEDDYDSEFRYKGKPIPSLQSLDKHGNVIYMGTFSKSLISSIRISFMVLPPTLITKYLKDLAEDLRVYKQTASRLHQDTLYKFMKEGYWSRHLNKMRTIYRKKHEVLLNAINKYMGDKVEIIGENAGLHILLKVKNDMSEKTLIEKALNVKVKVYPTSIYYNKPADIDSIYILLGFGGLKEEAIDEGIKLLAKAWFQ